MFFIVYGCLEVSKYSPPKAYPSMRVTLSGMVTDVRSEQPQKARLSMSVTKYVTVPSVTVAGIIHSRVPNSDSATQDTITFLL